MQDTIEQLLKVVDINYYYMYQNELLKGQEISEWKSEVVTFYERKILKNSALSIQDKIFIIFHSYLGQCDDFVDFLTLTHNGDNIFTKENFNCSQHHQIINVPHNTKFSWDIFKTFICYRGLKASKLLRNFSSTRIKMQSQPGSIDPHSVT